MPSNKHRLTDRLAAGLPAHDADSPAAVREYSDTEVTGLRLTVGKSGRKFFDFRYTFRKTKRILRLGEFPGIGVAEARRLCWEARAALGRGEDPALRRDERRAMPTFAEFTATYLEHARLVIRSARDSEQRLRDWVMPQFGNRPLDSIRRGEIERFHATLLERMPPASANRILACIKAVFTHALRTEVLDRSPAAGVKNHRENNARERCLSSEELGRYWAALEKEPNAVLRRCLRFIICTGVRREEASTARWDCIDMERHTLRLPRTKAGKARSVVLNSHAMQVILESERLPGNPFLFPGAKPGSHIVELKFAHRRALKLAGISDFRIHDFRHQWASMAVSGGRSLYDVQTALGHASPAMSARYSHLSDESVRSTAQRVGEAIEEAAARGTKATE
ncbi:MAG: tyrosine-type recombinase/integrase [Candidatus Sumerlaeia bacterium]|nr:tyrosine-type recombinase/integrase [Candidatus Sumerlaeia bacterium]